MTGTLSAREGAGLYLVRRARTLTAPHQLRLVATALVGVLAVDLARIHLGRLRSGDTVSWAGAGGELLSYLAIAVALWRPVVGLCLTGAALVLGLVTGGTGTEPALLLLVGALVATHGLTRLTQGFVLGAVGYAALSAALHPEHAAFALGWFGGSAVLGVALGAAVRRLLRLREGNGRELAELAAEDARLRADERRLLARELHDVVTHQLSNISLQVMSHSDSTDPDDLRRTLRKLDRFTDSALTELRLLVRVLRDDPATAAGTDEVSELTKRVPPTMAAADWARRLTDAGFDPAIEIPARADRLEMTVQGTITRTLDVAGENILRHAPPRSPCSVTLSLNATQVVLRVASPLPTAPTDPTPSLGWGLRGLRERVDLAGGSFSAESVTLPPAEPEWVVVVTLPL